MRVVNKCHNKNLLLIECKKMLNKILLLPSPNLHTHDIYHKFAATHNPHAAKHIEVGSQSDQMQPHTLHTSQLHINVDRY